MLSRNLLVFCVVSVFSISEALYTDTLEWPDSDDNIMYRNPPRWLIRFPETTTKMQEKEYGKESKKHYQSSNEKKYYVSKIEKTWFEARDDCKARNMVLVCTCTPAEHLNLINYLEDNFLEPRNRYSGYWMGSHIDHKFSPWIWECNGLMVRDFGWYPGEPNLLEMEHCMELRNMDMLEWNNIPCSLPRRYICETTSRQETIKNMAQGKKRTLHEEVGKDDDDDEHENNFSENSWPITRDERIRHIVKRQVEPCDPNLDNQSRGERRI